MVIEANNTNTHDNDSIETTNTITPSSSSSSSSANTTRSSTFGAAATIYEDNDALKAWEITTGKKIPKHIIPIAKVAYNLHHKENRGLTREDLVNNLSYSKGYAKKILYECQSMKLLIPLEGYKQGRFNEYFLATEIEKFLQRQNNRKEKYNTTSDFSPKLTVIQILVNEMTQRKPTFHKPIMHIKVIPITGVDFNEIYQSLTKEDGWLVKSQNNKAKVKSFRLDHKRSCTLQIYPNGKIVVALECTYRPFRLHESDSCREFFEAVGKISYILNQELNGSLIIPSTGNWLLKQYDRDITIPESELAVKYPYIHHWYSKEGIKIKTLGHVFQIYGKIMPICGKCLRVEENVSIKEDVPLEQGIKEVTHRPFEIINALDLLNKNNNDGKLM